MIRTLIVDDEAVTLDLHRLYVERLSGFVVGGECSSARAALGALLERPGDFDLILLDLTMPDGSGIDVLQALRSRGIRTDVIAITGVRDADSVRRMAALGVFQYLVKPYAFTTFRERMELYREHRRRTAATDGDATQAEIDALIGPVTSGIAIALPKGLSAVTLKRVTTELRSGGALSASEVSERLGVSRVAVRRYLEHLAEQGVVRRSARYGTRGRPETEYRWERSAPNG